MTTRKGRWAISPDSHVSHPMRFQAAGYYSRSKIWRPLGLTLRCMPNGRGPLRNPLQRISKQGRSALSSWTKCKEPAGTWSSAKSAWEVVQKLLSDKQQSTFIHKFGNSLGISFPKLYCVDSAEAYVMQESVSLRFLCEKKRYDLQPPNGHLHEKPSEKRVS
jgi:hypothetical protein